MTFLELVEKLHEECDVSGSAPTAVTNQTGEAKRLVGWIRESYKEIQNLHRQWRWMRVTFTCDTTAGDDTYAYGDCTDSLTASTIDRFSEWRFEDWEDPPKIYLQSTGVGGERWLIFTPWNWFKNIYRIGTQNNGSPAHITIDPQNNFVLGPQPNDTYVVTGDYRRSAQVLAADDDKPEMPSDYHMLIVYRAMRKYALFESAQEVLVRADTEYGPMLKNLENNQLDGFQLAGAMA